MCIRDRASAVGSPPDPTRTPLLDTTGKPVQYRVFRRALYDAPLWRDNTNIFDLLLSQILKKWANLALPVDAQKLVFRLQEASLSGPFTRALPLDIAGGCAPDFPYRLALHAFAMPFLPIYWYQSLATPLSAGRPPLPNFMQIRPWVKIKCAME